MNLCIKPVYIRQFLLPVDAVKELEKQCEPTPFNSVCCEWSLFGQSRSIRWFVVTSAICAVADKSGAASWFRSMFKL